MVQVEQVRELKVKYGYTDSKLGQETGYSRQYINQILNGSVAMTPAISARFSSLFPRINEGKNRTAEVRRKTRETDISLDLNIDGTGQWEVNTSIKMLDHLLSQVAQHGRFDLKLSATGDDEHHIAEDIAICLGKAFSMALGEKRGIVRMADSSVPMDDALANVVVDFSGRSYSVLALSFAGNDMAGFGTDLIRHFLESFASEGRLNLHARILHGTNDHHKAEALFKALGRALDAATRIDERISGALPSTKGAL